MPAWVDEQLPQLPEVMAHSDQRAHAIDRAVVDATEAWLLRDRVGETFDVLVIDADEHAATVMLDDPAVRARCAGDHLPVGERIRATLIEADVANARRRFVVPRSVRRAELSVVLVFRGGVGAAADLVGVGLGSGAQHRAQSARTP